MGVRGITGSLTAFDVEQAMATRSAALLDCVTRQRPRALGHVSGDISFHIALDGAGRVERVAVTDSDIGSAPLEACLAEVVATAPFPAPAGSQAAETQWRMSVDPLLRTAPPLDEAALEKVLEQHSDATYQSCKIAKRRRFIVHGYLGRGRKLHPLTVRARHPREASAEQLSCLTEALAHWTGWPRSRGYAKASFELRWIAAPPPRRGRAIRKSRGARPTAPERRDRAPSRRPAPPRRR